MRQEAPTQQIPLGVLQTAAAHKLGALQAICNSEREAPLLRIIGFSGIGTGCLIVLFSLIAYETLLNRLPLWQALLIPLVGASWMGVGIWIILAPYHSPRLCVFIYTEGLIYVKGKVEVIRWQQIERFWKNIVGSGKTQRILSYKIRRSDDTFFTFTHELATIEILGRQLEAQIERYLLPRAIAAYNAGSPIAFDEITISSHGISVRPVRTLLPWHEFNHLTIDDTSIHIYKQGEDSAWVAINVTDVPNIIILEGLIKHIKRTLAINQKPHIVAYRTGLTITFGKLRISCQGIDISNGKNVLPWSEIAGISIGEREVAIHRQHMGHAWDSTLPIWEISNVAELKELVAYIYNGR
jgi:hypothetical protein